MRPALAEAGTGEALNLGHRAEVEAGLLAAACGAAASEHSFANLYLYRAVHDYRLLRGPVPAVLGVTYDGRRHALPLVPLDAALPLLDVAECLYPVTDAMLAASRLRWRTTQAETDFDYLFEAPALAALPPAKRAQADRFAAEHAPALTLDPPDFEPVAFRLLALWDREVGKPERETDLAQCRAAIVHRQALGLRAAVVHAGGQPCGFLLAADLPDGSRALQFAKATRTLPGAYPWMFSAYAAGAGVPLNLEQDLGLPGLRQAKRALGPTALLRKYRVEPA